MLLKRGFLSFAAGLIFLALSIAAEATEIYEPFQSIRQLGMGGVYIFDPGDAGGMLQNPGYLCYNKGLNVTVFDVQLGVGDLNTYLDLTNDGTSSLPTSMSEYFGKSIWLNTNGYLSVTLPCFGIAGVYNGTGSFLLHNPAYPQLNTFYMTEYGAYGGGGFQIGDKFSFGMNIKRVTRKGGNYIFGAQQVASLSGSSGVQTLAQSIENEGIGWGIDMGIASRLDNVPFNPTLSASWRDLGSTAFVKTKGSDAPERQKDNLTLAATIDGSIPLLGISAGVEYRHVTDNSEQIGKKIHMGAEFHLAMFDFRTGLYQGYPSYGFGMDFWLIRMDASLYKVETGVYPGQAPQERFQIGFMTELGLDANFSLIDMNGRSRKLKQRR